MALETTRSLGQLKQECKKLNIKVELSQPREKKEDYIWALRKHFIAELYDNKLPVELEMMLSLDCPMLCKRYQELKPLEQENLWTGKEWYVEQKIDGVRMLLFSLTEKFDMYSRNLSVKDYLPVSYSDTIWTGYVDRSKLKHKFLLDSEIICTNPRVDTILKSKGVVTETGLQAVTAVLAMDPVQSHELQKTTAPLKFMVFDCLWFDGEWLLDKPLHMRRKYMKEAVEDLKQAGLNVGVPASTYKNRKAFYNAVIEAKKEGVVFKNLTAPYTATSSRKRDGWIKLKGSMSERLGGEVDAYITGFVDADPTRGWSEYIGGLEVSVLLRGKDGELKPHHIASVSNVPLETRKQMTKIVDGKPTLKEEYYGRVVEIDGQCVTSRAKRFKHAVLVQWRPDRSPETCIIEEEFLDSMII